MFSLNTIKSILKDYSLNAWEYLAGTGPRSQLMYPLEPQATPWTGKIPSRRPPAVLRSVPGNSQNIGVRFGHSKPHLTSVKFNWKPTMGQQSCETTKIRGKCSNHKVCLMVAPPIEPQMAE